MTCAEMPCESYQAGPEGPILVDAFADAAARCSLATFFVFVLGLAVLGLAGVRRTLHGCLEGLALAGAVRYVRATRGQTGANLG